jgi:glycosyltransferase involved in cell wall biosynthesis
MADKKIQIYYINQYYGKPISGGERYNFRIIEILKKNGYNLKIITDDMIPGILSKHNLFINFWFIINYQKFKSYAILIDSRLHSRVFIFFLLLKKLPSVKVIGTVHHLTWCTRGNKFLQWIDKKMEKIFISRCDYLIIPGEYTLKSIKTILKDIPPFKIIYPAVNWKKPKVGSYKREYSLGKHVNLLFVGILQERKGVIYLIQSIARIQYKNIMLHLVGDLNFEPEYVDFLKKTIKRLGLLDKVKIWGRVGNDVLNDLYIKSDIFILPSLYEGFGLVVLEAMKYGLPVIASKVTYLPELVKDMENGILVPPKNVSKLAYAIDTLCGKPEMRKEMGVKSLKLARHAYTKDDFENDVVDTFKYMLKVI